MCVLKLALSVPCYFFRVLISGTRTCVIWWLNSEFRSNRMGNCPYHPCSWEHHRMVRVRPHPGSSYPHEYSWPGLAMEEEKWEHFAVEKNTFVPWQSPQIRYEQRNPLCFSSNFLTSDSHQDNKAGESLNFLKKLQLGTSVPSPEASQLWQRNTHSADSFSTSSISKTYQCPSVSYVSALLIYGCIQIPLWLRSALDSYLSDKGILT